MKATLEFNLPEEDSEYRAALNGAKWQQVLWEIDDWLRDLRKHSDKNTISIQEVRDRIYEELQSGGLSFD